MIDGVLFAYDFEKVYIKTLRFKRVDSNKKYMHAGGVAMWLLR